jgi:hypothetical protein
VREKKMIFQSGYNFRVKTCFNYLSLEFKVP